MCRTDSCEKVTITCHLYAWNWKKSTLIISLLERMTQMVVHKCIAICALRSWNTMEALHRYSTIWVEGKKSIVKRHIFIALKFILEKDHFQFPEKCTNVHNTMLCCVHCGQCFPPSLPILCFNPNTHAWKQTDS